MQDPESIKHYEILSRLGEGGMGVVYRARDTRLGRIVALKMLRAELARDEERSRRFEREARIISTMSHPGIATLYDFDRDGELAYLAMELVEGPTLRDRLGEGPPPVEQTLDFAVQVAETLAAAHREGVIHRDLKPENVMITESGYYKVLDFGVARMEEPKPAEGASTTQTPTVSWATRAGGIVGTVSYMSPEQALAEPVDARSDIFSFGTLLYEVACGTPPFRGKNEIATAQAIVNEPHEPLRARRPELPRGLELIVDKCLAKKPRDRYPSADALAADLRALRLDTLAGTQSGSRLLAYRTSSQRRRVRWISAASAGAIALLAGALWLWRPWSEPVAPRLPAVPSALAEPAVGPPAAEKPRVIVAFFENLSGDPEADWLSRGLPEMLTTDLSRSDRLDVIATQRLYDLLAMSGQPTDAPLDRSTAAELARWAGATVVISGSVFKQADRFRIDAQAYSTETGRVEVAHKVEGAELFAMVDELTSGLLTGLQASPGHEGAFHLVSTSSEEAFRHYTRGKAHYENLEFQRATEEFRRSLLADEQFALARLRLAMSLLAAGEREAALPQLDAAVAGEERMPEADRLLARALHAYVRGNDFETGTGWIEQLVERHPETHEAYLVWARGLLELDGNPLQATLKLRRAIESDPGNLPAIAALADQLDELGQHEAALAILDEARLRNPQAADSLARLIEPEDAAAD